MSTSESSQILRLTATSLAGLVLNPCQMTQILRQSGGQLIACAWHLLRRSRLAAHGDLRLPFSATWRVEGGDVDRAGSHSWRVLTQRYAYDFVAAPSGVPASTVRTLASYPAYGRPVLAAADGEVVGVLDGIRDHPLPGTGAIDWRARDIRGNHVVVRHRARAYGLYAHLQPGTCAVRRGDRVARGDLLGRCGNSGHSTEPHLHFHIQDRRSFYLSIGVPIMFTHFETTRREAQGRQAVASGVLHKGDEVRPVDASAPNALVQPHPAPGTIGVTDLAYSAYAFLLNLVFVAAPWYFVWWVLTRLVARVQVS